MELTQERLKELLHYDPETGIFRWRVARGGKTKPWDVAGYLNSSCLSIRVNYKLCKAHRLAWLYMTGNWPNGDIDHVDGNPSNNAWINLRDVSHKQNMENLGLMKTNTSGYRGVSWHKQGQKWRARVKHNYKEVHIGLFDTAEEARIAVISKRAELFTHDAGRDQVTQNSSIVI